MNLRIAFTMVVSLLVHSLPAGGSHAAPGNAGSSGGQGKVAEERGEVVCRDERGRVKARFPKRKSTVLSGTKTGRHRLMSEWATVERGGRLASVGRTFQSYAGRHALHMEKTELTIYDWRGQRLFSVSAPEWRCFLYGSRTRLVWERFLVVVEEPWDGEDEYGAEDASGPPEGVDPTRSIRIFDVHSGKLLLERILAGAEASVSPRGTWATVGGMAEDGYLLEFVNLITGQVTRPSGLSDSAKGSILEGILCDDGVVHRAWVGNPGEGPVPSDRGRYLSYSIASGWIPEAWTSKSQSCGDASQR